ncbi:protein of unknown function (plasmid) [Caballeronia sp. S22]
MSRDTRTMRETPTIPATTVSASSRRVPGVCASVRGDDGLRLSLSGRSLVGVHGEAENGGQGIGRCDVDYVVSFGKMEVVGTREQFAQCGFVPSGKSEVRHSLGLDRMQQPPGQRHAFVDVTPRYLTRDLLQITHSAGKLPPAEILAIRLHDSPPSPTGLIVLYKHTVLVAMKLASRYSTRVYVRFRLRAFQTSTAMRAGQRSAS